MEEPVEYTSPITQYLEYISNTHWRINQFIPFSSTVEFHACFDYDGDFNALSMQTQVYNHEYKNFLDCPACTCQTNYTIAKTVIVNTDTLPLRVVLSQSSNVTFKMYLTPLVLEICEYFVCHYCLAATKALQSVSCEFSHSFIHT